MEKLYTPVAIVIGGLLIGAAILYSQGEAKIARIPTDQAQQGSHQVTPEREAALVDPRRTDHRHVVGGEDPQVTIVEFSDYECPFCARLHPTLERIVEEYEGDVAWEYRHLPLVMHPNARRSAEVSECVADLAGNDAFWEFTNYLFANQRNLNERTYQVGAEAVGLVWDEVVSCSDRPDIAERVLQDERTAVALGGSGTPFSVVVYQDGTTRAVPGALPYSQFKALVER